METTRIKKVLQDFFAENKKELLEKDEIISIAGSLYSLYPYGTYNKQSVHDINSKEEILFGFKSGLLITSTKCYYFFIHGTTHSVTEFPHKDLLQISSEKKMFGEKIVFKGFVEGWKKFETDLYKKIKSKVEPYYADLEAELKRQEIEKLKHKEEQIKTQKEALNQNQSSILNELDKDGNGEVDLIENDFNKLLNKNQKKVIEIDKNYIHQFVKVSNYIKTKRQNKQHIFESIKHTQNQSELDERVNLLKNQIHTYELLLFHSLNMIASIVDEEMIVFYEIYESFDKLGIYNSNWENEVSEKLSTIGDKIDELMYSIYQMENKIVNEIGNLSYVTQESFGKLNNSVTRQLGEIDSTIKFNNLLTGVQTYQLYKINKNTKSLGH